MTKKDNKKNFWLEEFESFYVEEGGADVLRKNKIVLKSLFNIRDFIN